MSDQKIEFQLDPQNPSAVYSDIAAIFHTPEQFRLDFAQTIPNSPKARVLTSVVMTPQHAKRFLQALMENIQRYEASFGEIKPVVPPPREIGFKVH